MKRAFVITFLLSGCISPENVSVFESETYWGGTTPDGVVFTAITETLDVRRNGAVPYTEADLDRAVAAAKAHCASWNATFEGTISDDDAGLPTFNEGVWQIAGACLR